MGSLRRALISASMVVQEEEGKCMVILQLACTHAGDPGHTPSAVAVGRLKMCPERNRERGRVRIRLIG